MTEFPQATPGLGLLGITQLDARGRQPVEDTELPLAEPLVDGEDQVVAGEAARLGDRLRRLPDAQIGRGQDDGRALVDR